MRRELGYPILVVFVPLVAGCGGCLNSSPRIACGGATFVNPIMQKWSGEYRMARSVEIDYVSKGSGYGIEQMSARTIEFGCTDAPMKKEQLAAAIQRGGEVFHIPVTMGAVAIVYNVPEIQGHELHLSGEVLADIYLRKIDRWNDGRIAALNPEVPLPARDIVVVARAESSGTTNIFTEYLSKVSTAFAAEVGTSTKPRWPQGVTPQEQSDGVAGFVKDNEGTIGYVELLFARKNRLPAARLKNRDGNWTAPEADSVTATAEEALKLKHNAEPYSLHDLTYSLTDVPGAQSYPICGMSYAILFAKQPNGNGPIIVEFLKWATTDGQRFCRAMDYAPLPDILRQKIHEKLAQVTYD